MVCHALYGEGLDLTAFVSAARDCCVSWPLVKDGEGCLNLVQCAGQQLVQDPEGLNNSMIYIGKSAHLICSRTIWLEIITRVYFLFTLFCYPFR